MKKIVTFLKAETVLSIAAILAVISAFVVHPDQTYLGYIDFRTLAILYSLMCIMNGFQKIGVFDWIARKMIDRTRGLMGVVATLVFMCFFSSMLITNDVALITFVPLAIITFRKLESQVNVPTDQSGADHGDMTGLYDGMVIATVVLQTLAANLGSMLTPLGNPQNLYLYGKLGGTFAQFLKIMLPYSLMSLLLLLLGILLLGLKRPGQGKDLALTEHSNGTEETESLLWNRERKLLCAAYVILFGLSLLCVLHILAYQVLFVLVLVVMLVLDLVFGRHVVRTTDLSLILTFVFLFIFIGNLGRLDAFRSFLEGFVSGREVVSAVIASQVISNVPAAILLSGFTDNTKALVIGTNLGGLGTLIASMASLISFKYIAKWKSRMRGRYFIAFTMANIIFLVILLGQYLLIA